MSGTDLEHLADTMAQGLKDTLASDNPLIFAHVLRLLAEGDAVSIDRIGAALGISREEAAARLGKMPNVERDPDGNILGLGLTLTPTPHSFVVSGRKLFAWCALDTLFFPGLIGHTAQVESPCPTTGQTVRLTVTPERVENLEPADAVVSLVVPDAAQACCDIRTAFCNEVHFFGSREAASTWSEEHSGAVVLSVAEAFRLGRMLTNRVFERVAEGEQDRSPADCRRKPGM